MAFSVAFAWQEPLHTKATKATKATRATTATKATKATKALARVCVKRTQSLCFAAFAMAFAWQESLHTKATKATKAKATKATRATKALRTQSLCVAGVFSY